jgi:NCS1 family nucleobase:cation symporter-1
MAVIMAPIGAIIFAEHFLFKSIGLTRYWRVGKGDKLNMPAAITWASSALFAYLLGSVFGIHIFFLFIPTWIAALILYPILSSIMGAKSADTQKLDQMERIETDRKAAEAKALRSLKSDIGRKRPLIETLLLLAAALALVVCFYLGFKAAGNADSAGFKSAIIWPTVIYFIAATLLVFLHKDETDNTA